MLSVRVTVRSAVMSILLKYAFASMPEAMTLLNHGVVFVVFQLPLASAIHVPSAQMRVTRRQPAHRPAKARPFFEKGQKMMYSCCVGRGGVSANRRYLKSRWRIGFQQIQYMRFSDIQPLEKVSQTHTRKPSEIPRHRGEIPLARKLQSSPVFPFFTHQGKTQAPPHR